MIYFEFCPSCVYRGAKVVFTLWLLEKRLHTMYDKTKPFWVWTFNPSDWHGSISSVTLSPLPQLCRPATSAGQCFLSVYSLRKLHKATKPWNDRTDDRRRMYLSRRRSRHVARMDADVSGNRALWLMTGHFDRVKPEENGWKRPTGRLRKTWSAHIYDDARTAQSVLLCTQEVGMGLEAAWQSSETMRQWWWWWWWSNGYILSFSRSFASKLFSITAVLHTVYIVV